MFFLFLFLSQYSDDMGKAKASACPDHEDKSKTASMSTGEKMTLARDTWESYIRDGFVLNKSEAYSHDPAGDYLPLVEQTTAATGVVSTHVLEQPLDFSPLAAGYADKAKVTTLYGSFLSQRAHCMHAEIYSGA